MMPEKTKDHLIRRIAKMSGVLSHTEIAMIAKVAEIGKCVLTTTLKKEIQAADHAPILRSATADGTPATVSRREKILLPDNTVKRLYGKERHEYLMACEMLRCRTSNGENPRPNGCSRVRMRPS